MEIGHAFTPISHLEVDLDRCSRCSSCVWRGVGGRLMMMPYLLQKGVNGKVYLMVYKGNAHVIGRSSETSNLYSQTEASMDTLEGFNREDTS